MNDQELRKLIEKVQTDDMDRGTAVAIALAIATAIESKKYREDYGTFNVEILKDFATL